MQPATTGSSCRSHGSTFTDSGTGTVHAAPVPEDCTACSRATRSGAGQIDHISERRYRLAMQGDGNLVEYDGSRVAWASDEPDRVQARVMQGDGNFVVYDGLEPAALGERHEREPGRLPRFWATAASSTCDPPGERRSGRRGRLSRTP